MTQGYFVLDLEKFPDYFRSYHWQAKHSLYGYPADISPKFEWMLSLEKRFSWLRINCEVESTSAIYLLKEMIQWGGSQSGTLQKFEDGLEQHNMRNLVLETVTNLKDPEKAIAAALKFPGMGLTYASKMLRFFDPEHYGAIDSRIRKALLEREPSVLPKIYDSSNSSMVAGYVAFTKYVDRLKAQLEASEITRPTCDFPLGLGSTQWRSADVEMALFGWASSVES
jgi:hypothetical protein